MRQKSHDNPRYPHKVVITRLYADDDGYGDDVTEVLYEGVGHSFTDTTTTGDNKMMENRRKASIPVRFDMWVKPILPNDTIKVTMGNVVEEGTISDFEPDNDRTIIYWEYGRC